MALTPADRLIAARDALMDWLLTDALPIWQGFGVDHVQGGFHETLGLRCEIRPQDRRTRVLARQVFSFAVAGRLGWSGPWQRTVADGLGYFLSRAIGPDGLVRKVIAFDGSPVDDSFSLYDQAFALFAFAAAASVVEDRGPVEAAAIRLFEEIERRYRHPVAGFEEASPRSLPLKANPHMHLFEAALAWTEAGGDARWPKLADEIAGLCLTRFLDPAEGWLHEFFDGDWKPMPGVEGKIVEPGHHFEWAWLMVRWGEARGRTDAYAAARRLTDLAERHGMNAAEGVAVNEILDDRSPRDPTARLWPQTERIKAHVALARIAEDPAPHHAAAADAAAALMRYFKVDTPGLWRDRMNPDGSFRIEPAPASSFYHIICAIEEIDKAARRISG